MNTTLGKAILEEKDKEQSDIAKLLKKQFFDLLKGYPEFTVKYSPEANRGAMRDILSEQLSVGVDNAIQLNGKKHQRGLRKDCKNNERILLEILSTKRNQIPETNEASVGE